MENNLNTLRGAGFDIALEITWIACEVFVGSKLERVHEDAHHRALSVLRGKAKAL